MELMEWNVICRVCLQGGEMRKESDMRSIYEKDDKNLTICDKIIKCSNITIKRGMNLPEQICNICLEDLNIAYKFRTNCENSDAILQSFLEGNPVTNLIMSSQTGEVYKYKPPQGLNVKRIRPVTIKCEIQTDDSNQNQKETILDYDTAGQEIIEEQYDPNDGNDNDNGIVDDHCGDGDDIDDDDNYVPQEDDNNSMSPEQATEDSQEKEESKFETGVFIKTHIKEDVTQENQFEISADGKVCTIKPVKTNKARSKSSASKEKLRVIAPTEISTKPDGTTVIRVRRNIEEPKPLKICDICGNTYKYKHALESHMRRHRNEKPFSCEICGRAFVINFELRRHMRTHTGQKPYACRYCGRKFSDFGSRIKHERTHTGERPYSCDTCGKSFAYSHVLSSHILTHTGEKRFGCTECGKRFAKSHHLKAHMNTHLKNANKTILIKSGQTIPIMADQQYQQQQLQHETNEKSTIIYQSGGEVYHDVINVLSTQPKIENFEEEEYKVMYTTPTGSSVETQQAINTINMST